MTAGAALALAIATAMALLGLPPVDLHSPLHTIGIMDPLCGGTRAARYAAQGNLAEAWRYNPLSILILLAAVLAIVRASVGMLGGCWVNASMMWTPVRRRWVIFIVITLLVLLGIRQQLRAELLMAGTHNWV